MRQRLRPLRARAMARRPGENGRINLGPRERRLLGWIAALVLVIGIAVVVGILGGNGDGAPIAPNGSAAPSTGTTLPITFGTALDDATHQVAEATRTDRFTSGDTFAYSIPWDEQQVVPPTVYVEVERVAGGTPEVVQDASSEGEQTVPADRTAVAFTVRAEVLFTVFGPGEYRMRIFLDPASEPLAEGSFTLVAGVASSAAPSAAP
ncbi:MAG: hypothetical protein M3Y40_05030 [Chloroflexota bacterium]|nr:hypothetical protein [Chloroflexota bacterium]